MKKYITDEQWKEISEEHRYKIKKWYNNPIVDKWDIDQSLSLDIGTMIHFLFDKDFEPQIYSDDHAFFWTVEPGKKLECWSKGSFERGELCDALWEAVKEVLRQ